MSDDPTLKDDLSSVGLIIAAIAGAIALVLLGGLFFTAFAFLLGTLITIFIASWPFWLVLIIAIIALREARRNR